MLKASSSLETNGGLNASEDRTQAFDGLAEKYDIYRPSYPGDVYQSIINFLGVAGSTHPVIVDVGCGTGLSTRAFYKALSGQCNLIGIEPGNDMLNIAIKTPPAEIVYRKGHAESLPLENDSVDIVTAAQAAQWFNRIVFYTEAKRVLKSSGILAMYENNRDWKHSEFLRSYEEFLEFYSEGYSRYYRDCQYEKELTDQNFKNVVTLSFCWNKKMTPEEFLAMAKTSTQVTRAINKIGIAEIDRVILENAKKHVGRDDKVDVPYITKLYMGRK